MITSQELIEMGPEFALSQLDGLGGNQLLLVLEVASREMRSSLELNDAERMAGRTWRFGPSS